MNTEKIAVVEWVDAFGCPAGWEFEEEALPRATTVRSVGHVLSENEFVMLAPHISKPGGQRQKAVGGAYCYSPPSDCCNESYFAVFLRSGTCVRTEAATLFCCGVDLGSRRILAAVEATLADVFSLLAILILNLMNEKPVKVEIDSNEALRRVAQTPKDAVVKKEKALVNKDLKVYNAEKAVETPPSPAKRRT